eukprot:1176197-Prorocentrum_minimum.AAC.1
MAPKGCTKSRLQGANSLVRGVQGAISTSHLPPEGDGALGLLELLVGERQRHGGAERHGVIRPQRLLERRRLALQIRHRQLQLVLRPPEVRQRPQAAAPLLAGVPPPFETPRGGVERPRHEPRGLLRAVLRQQVGREGVEMGRRVRPRPAHLVVDVQHSAKRSLRLRKLLRLRQRRRQQLQVGHHLAMARP